MPAASVAARARSPRTSAPKAICSARRSWRSSTARTPHAANDQGATALHYAAQSGLNSVVQLLADYGAVLDAKDKQGRMPADSAMGVGGRGRAGGPPIVHKDTAELINRLIAERGSSR